MSDFPKNELNRVRRLPQRAHYDKETIYKIVDEALLCHVGFVQDGRPFVIPTIHARDNDRLILHGAKASRLIKHIQGGHEVCVTITLVDGLVMARATFHNSMNYRSVVLFGKGQPVVDEQEKLRCSEILSEHLLPDRWLDTRPPNPKELNATGFAVVEIESATAKIRTGQPVDDEEDYQLPIWAGVLPIQQQFGIPQADPRLDEEITLPPYLTNGVQR